MVSASRALEIAHAGTAVSQALHSRPLIGVGSQALFIVAHEFLRRRFLCRTERSEYRGSTPRRADSERSLPRTAGTPQAIVPAATQWSYRWARVPPPSARIPDFQRTTPKPPQLLERPVSVRPPDHEDREEPI